MKLSRRKFLITTGVVGGGLLIGFNLGDAPIPNTVEGSFQPNAFLQITPDGRVIFQLHKVEMGQGTMTSLPALLADELDYDLYGIEVEQAKPHPAYNDPRTMSQITGGSTSMPTSWLPLRECGAAARAMLVAAAAAKWGVTPASCQTDDGIVSNLETGQTLSYAELAPDASNYADAEFSLKQPADFKYIGKSIARVDAVAKSNGTAEFGVDINPPNCLTAVIVRCPHFGGSVKAWDEASVKDQTDVVAAFEMHSGIAIVAKGYWPARSAAKQLKIEWNKGPLAGVNNASITEAQRQALTEEEPNLTLDEGDTQAALATATNTLKAEYQAPFLNHSTMEPMNATALYEKHADGDTCELWTGSQAAQICRTLVAQYTNAKQDNITVNTTLMGGGFGRRSYPDFVAEVAVIAEQMAGTPVKLIWSREDDVQHDFYRPASLHGIQAALNDEGKLEAWEHKVVAASLAKGAAVNIVASLLPAWVPASIARSLGSFVGNTAEKYDPTTTEGAKLFYKVPNKAAGNITYDPGIPAGFWRSVAFSSNTFVSESFMDEMAHAANTDPLEFRLSHLETGSRTSNVLALAAEKAAWGSSNAAQGLAVAELFNAHCAMVAEVSVNGSEFSVDRVIATVDCGIAVDPENVKAQIESSIIYGLSAALKEPVRIEDGRVTQSNFHDLPVLRMNETPKMEVYIVDSDRPPTGIGEVGLPPLAPAVANALFTATGQRLRGFPLKLS